MVNQETNKLTYNIPHTFLFKQLDMYDNVEIFKSFTFDLGNNSIIDVYLLTEKEEGCAIIVQENYISLISSWSGFLATKDINNNSIKCELIGNWYNQEEIENIKIGGHYD